MNPGQYKASILLDIVKSAENHFNVTIKECQQLDHNSTISDAVEREHAARGNHFGFVREHHHMNETEIMSHNLSSHSSSDASSP